jgi:hypothetical protein
MQTMAEAMQLHKSTLVHLFAAGKKRTEAALKLLAAAFAAVVFRNVLPRQWTTGHADAQGGKCALAGLVTGRTGPAC